MICARDTMICVMDTMLRVRDTRSIPGGVQHTGASTIVFSMTFPTFIMVSTAHTLVYCTDIMLEG